MRILIELVLEHIAKYGQRHVGKIKVEPKFGRTLLSAKYKFRYKAEFYKSTCNCCVHLIECNKGQMRGNMKKEIN